MKSEQHSSVSQSRSQSPHHPCPAVERATRTSGKGWSAWLAEVQESWFPFVEMKSNTCAVEPEVQESCHGGSLPPEVLVDGDCTLSYSQANRQILQILFNVISSQVTVTIRRYPFVLLGGEDRGNMRVFSVLLKDTKQWPPGQGSNLGRSIQIH